MPGLYQTRNRFPNTEERAENTTRRGIFLTNFQLFGNVVKYCLECFSIESKTKAKTEKQNRKKLCQLRSDIPRSGFLLFELDE